VIAVTGTVHFLDERSIVAATTLSRVAASFGVVRSSMDVSKPRLGPMMVDLFRLRGRQVYGQTSKHNLERNIQK
jgi:hypothetical protein